MPKTPAGGGVNSIGISVARSEVHDALDHKRNSFECAMNLGLVDPLDTQVLNVPIANLFQTAVASGVIVTPIRQPFIRPVSSMNNIFEREICAAERQ